MANRYGITTETDYRSTDHDFLEPSGLRTIKHVRLPHSSACKVCSGALIGNEGLVVHLYTSSIAQDDTDEHCLSRKNGDTKVSYLICLW